MLNEDLKADTCVANRKLELLRQKLQELGSALIAFSGGVDSSFLLKVASDELKEGAVALTATSPTYLDSELEEAKALAQSLNVKHIIVDSNELLIPNFAENPENRCYYCKSELFTICSKKARSLELACVLDGSNADDVMDHRPGKTAAIELKVRSLLEECDLTKAEIRVLSKGMGLSTWEKPNLACLSSRFPYGTKITEERLDSIKRCESFLKGLGMKQLRVRFHNESARIEADEEGLKMMLQDGVREEVVKEFKAAGFTYVTLDMEGYRTGSMNEVLKAGDKKDGGKHSA